MKQFLIENGVPENLLDNLSEEQLLLLTEYVNATREYYVSDDEMISDAEFDDITEKIKSEMLSVYNWLQTVIYRIDKFMPALQHEMLSLHKIKIDNSPTLRIRDIYEFFKTNYGQSNFYMAPKFDGCSLKVIFNSVRKVQKIITRGGNDVTEKMLPVILRTLESKKLPDTIFNNGCITGELVISKQIFKDKYLDADYANPRNFVSGILNRKNVDTDILNDLVFVPCTDGINPIHCDLQLNDSTKYEYNLRYSYDSLRDINYLKEIFDFCKSDNFPYLCDGLVISVLETSGDRRVKDNYPLNMVAVKFPAPTATTEIVGIDWTQKKSGKLTPVIKLKPVSFDGSVISACSGYNWYQVNTKKLGNGAIVEIEKSGDIIPVIKRVIKKSNDIQMPSCQYKISGKHLISVNDEDSKKFKFICALRLLQLQGIGDTIAEQIGSVVDYNILNCFDTGYKPIIHSVLGTGASWLSFSEIYNIHNIPFNTLIELLQFDNVGPKTAMKLALLITKKSTDMRNIPDSVLQQIIRGDGMNILRAAIASLKQQGISVLKPIEVSETDLTYEMSGNPPGMTKQEFVNRLKSIYPNSIHTTLNKQTKVLFVDSENSGTSKVAKARKYNIRIVTYRDMLENKIQL